MANEPEIRAVVKELRGRTDEGDILAYVYLTVDNIKTKIPRRYKLSMAEHIKNLLNNEVWNGIPRGDSENDCYTD